jgi:branched-chain amino acid transport system substrate-binding protein
MTMTTFQQLALGAGAVLAIGSGWSGAAAAADDTIVLGAAVSITGKYSTNGGNTKDGYDLAVKMINDKGGVKVGDKTYQLEVVYYDDESTPARAAQLTERLIDQDGVQFMLGPYGSGLTKAVAPITEKFKVPMVEANGAARELFTQGYEYIFAVLSTSDYYLRDAIKLAAEQAEAAGTDPSEVTVAIAVENDPFSLDVRDGVIEDAEKYGMQVVIDDKLPPELNDMSATLTKVKALKPDILVVSAHEKGPPLAIGQMQEMRVDVPMLALTHCDSARVAEQMGEAAESSAGVLVFADALERASSLDPAAVRDALAATDIMTFYGPVKFDETGKNTAKPMVLYQIQDGQYKVVAPAEWAAAELIHPMPTWEERDGT